MENQMAENKNDAKETKGAEKQEQSFDEKLFADGWPAYFLSTEIRNLDNPNPTQGTLGFRDALTKKQVVVNAPVDEWLKVLTAMAKKAAAKS